MNVGPLIASLVPAILAICVWILFAQRLKLKVRSTAIGFTLIIGGVFSGYEIGKYEDMYQWSERRRDVSLLLSKLLLENDTLLADKLRKMLDEKVTWTSDGDYDKAIEASRDNTKNH